MIENMPPPLPAPRRVVEFSNGSLLAVHEYSSVQECARLTAPLLEVPTVGLSGGSTYATLFPLWAQLHPRCHATSFFPVDERMVPFNEPASNWGAAQQLFFGPLGLRDQAANHPTTRAGFLERLSSRFGTGIPRFDVLFLGVGDDGHTASLFPGTAYPDDCDNVVLQTVSPKPPTDRLTLGPAVLREARCVALIVAEAGKAAVVSSIYAGDQTLPIVQVLRSRPRSDLFVAEAA